jgi:hypothetical protein
MVLKSCSDISVFLFLPQRESPTSCSPLVKTKMVEGLSGSLKTSMQPIRRDVKADDLRSGVEYLLL